MEEEKKEEQKTEEAEEAEEPKEPEPRETVEEVKEPEVEEEKIEEAPEKAEETVEEEAAAEEELAPAEEEAKPSREKPEEEEIVEERIYTIPLSRAWIMPPNKRAPRAIRIIKSFLIKHMKLEAPREGEEEAEPRKLIISNEVNELVWSRGIEKPPRKIRVRAARDKEGNVTVYLAEGD